MSNWKLNRRKLLTCAGVLFTLPLLESLGGSGKKAMAADGNTRRFVSLYMPNGTYNVKGDAVWYPQTGALSKNLPPVLSPFGDHIGDFSVLMHPGCQARDQVGSQGGHVSAVTTFLSNQAFTDGGSSQCTVPGSSFDQMIADTTKTKPLVLSAGGHTDKPDNTAFDYADYVSYNNGQPNDVNKNPVALFNLIFSGLVATPGMPMAPTAAAARNKSILDSSLADIKDLQSKLGKNDVRKLDAYMASVRSLETRLQGAPTMMGGGCMPGKGPDSSLDNYDKDALMSDNYVQRVQAFFDMIVLGFQCDLFRSVSFMYDGETCQRHNTPCPEALRFNGVDTSPMLHTGLSHYNQNDFGTDYGRSMTIGRDRLYLSLFFYLLDALKQASDTSGAPILDNTIVLAGFNVVDGQHLIDNAEGVPLVVGGGRNFMHPGNCFDLAGADLKDLYYTFSTFLQLGWSDYLGSTNVLKV